MKKKPVATPTRSKLSIFRQLCNLIPTHLVAQLARDTGSEKKSRSFKPWSHLVSLLFAQFTHALGLNDVSDSLRLHSGPLSAIRGVPPPSRNGLSTANRERPAALAEQLFWKTLDHLQGVSPAFGSGRGGKRLAHRFKTAIHVLDATTIQLLASCLDWAKHRRRKAAAKCHLRLDLHSFLPRFALLDTARDNDAKRAREVCAGIRAGEIVLFDKAYVDFAHLHDLNQRGVFWVTRAQDNLQFKVAKRRIKKPAGKILRDDEIRLIGVRGRADHPQRMRRVVALVEVDGVEREMLFLTNNFAWAGHRGRVVSVSVADRSVFQTDQTDAATGGLPGQLGQRGALAGLDGAPGLCAVALPGVSVALGQQLRAVVDVRACRAVVETRRGGAAQKLWDSRGRLSIAGPAASRISAGISSRRCGIATVRQTPEYRRMI